MKTISTRLTINSKDIQRITGKSERSARTLLKKIKETFSKEDHQYITIDEFSAYTGIKAEMVKQSLVS